MLSIIQLRLCALYFPPCLSALLHSPSFQLYFGSPCVAVLLSTRALSRSHTCPAFCRVFSSFLLCSFPRPVSLSTPREFVLTPVCSQWRTTLNQITFYPFSVRGLVRTCHGFLYQLAQAYHRRHTFLSITIFLSSEASSVIICVPPPMNSLFPRSSINIFLRTCTKSNICARSAACRCSFETTMRNYITKKGVLVTDTLCLADTAAGTVVASRTHP